MFHHSILRCCFRENFNLSSSTFFFPITASAFYRPTSIVKITKIIPTVVQYPEYLYFFLFLKLSSPHFMFVNRRKRARVHIHTQRTHAFTESCMSEVHQRVHLNFLCTFQMLFFEHTLIVQIQFVFLIRCTQSYFIFVCVYVLGTAVQ